MDFNLICKALEYFLPVHQKGKHKHAVRKEVLIAYRSEVVYLLQEEETLSTVWC